MGKYFGTKMRQTANGLFEILKEPFFRAYIIAYMSFLHFLRSTTWITRTECDAAPAFQAISQIDINSIISSNLGSEYHHCYSRNAKAISEFPKLASMDIQSTAKRSVNPACKRELDGTYHRRCRIYWVLRGKVPC
jgi:hypothetical protein